MKLETARLVPRWPRTGRARRYLMCPPIHFGVHYSINPWMDPGAPVDVGVAVSQWGRLRRILLDLGHAVELIEPLPDAPDMVFAANGGSVAAGRVLAAKFRHAQRAAEGPAYAAWFRAHGFPVREPDGVNEGEGDFLPMRNLVLAGTGFRTDVRSHAEAAEVFGRPVVSLRLVDPRFYHLDTALAALTDDEIMYYPGAFAPESRRALAELFPDAVLATAGDAAVFGLNAISDGRHVVLSSSAERLGADLRSRGFVPHGVDLSELRKAGGGAKCCVLELREQ